MANRPPGRQGRKIDYQIAVNMLASGSSYDEIGAKFGIKGLSVQTGLSRKGLLSQIAKVPTERHILVTIPATPMAKQSDRVRSTIANELHKQADALSSRPPTREELGGRNGRTATVKTLVDAASIVFGWHDQGVPSLLLSAPLPEPGQAIDVSQCDTTKLLTEPAAPVTSPSPSDTPESNSPKQAQSLS